MKILTGITANDHHALFVRLTSERLVKSVIADFTSELNAHSTDDLTESLTRRADARDNGTTRRRDET